MAKGASCCDDSCCDANGGGDAYAADELASLGLNAAVSLGCGNPLLLADLRPGEDVLDLWGGCVAGTISLDAYTEQLQAAGFDAIDIEVTREVRLEDVEGLIASAYIRARRPSRVEMAAK